MYLTIVNSGVLSRSMACRKASVNVYINIHITNIKNSKVVCEDGVYVLTVYDSEGTLKYLCKCQNAKLNEDISMD